jgi:hypothetical protein
MLDIGYPIKILSVKTLNQSSKNKIVFNPASSI